MPRHLFIVSRQHPELYADLLERFANDPKVEVVLDRRKNERRGHAEPVRTDHRHGERRRRPDVDVQLRSRSHVIVSLDSTPARLIQGP